MSFRTNNIECTGCDFFEYEVFYRTSEGPPDCPECGSKRKMSFKGFTCAIHGQGPGSFAAVDFGVLGKAETKEDYDRCIKTIEKRFPGKRVNIQGESEAQKSERLDTMRHGSWQRKKAQGLNDKIIKEVSTHKKRLASEGRSENRSPAQLVGNK
jgi:hypothetical protein|tara:strand:- start:1689 stop:2150 length:462 start_codon:yes stop_codon:yes gene_type:complete